MADYDLIIRNGRIVGPSGVVEGDLAAKDGRIAAIGSLGGAARREIDAGGKWVMPGGVDPHAHIEQMSGMGLMSADTFETAHRSAAMGGTTSVISFAAQKKGQRLSEAMADYAARAKRGAMVDHAFHIIVSDTDVPDFERDLAALIDAGHRSIKVFTTYNIKLEDAEILRVLRIARDHGALVCVHAETDCILSDAKKRLLAAGHVLPKHHALSHPRLAEIEAVDRICNFAAYVETPVMLFHISTAEAAARVKAARAQKTPIWAETCPHYLFMTEDILDQPDGGKWMCSPPQRTASDQTALWHALETGTLDLVSSDHAPYRYDETGKLSAGPNAPFDKIANGMPGLEVRQPLMFDALVSKQRAPTTFARMTAGAAADIYGFPGKGRLAEGFDADLVIWDPDRQVTYADNDLHDNVGYNPWVGQSVTGWPETVLLRGEILVEDRVFKALPGGGAWLHRAGLGPSITG